MMQLLLPLGLIGLIGILVLILIYIIKPNYQTKHVSTTFVWKLSLKYRKKRLPTSKIRNIILFLCQLFILASMAAIFAQPAIVHNNDTGELDVIAIVDSSASMYAGTGNSSRFDRAVEGARRLSEETLAQGGSVSLILADGNPQYLARRVSQKSRNLLFDEFDAIEDGEISCSYGKSDVDAAMTLAEDVLAENPSAKIHLFTDVEYSYVPDNVTVVSVAEKGEWNAAILSVTTELVDGYYTVTVEMASYGKTQELHLKLNVDGADADGHNIAIDKTVYCDENSVKTVIFCDDGGADTDNTFYEDIVASHFYSYRALRVSLDEADDFATDNNFCLYDGQKETVKVLYASTDPNPFFTSALDTMKELFADRWDLQVEEVPKGKEYPQEGFDFYIFEHQTPESLPVDGAVLLADPQAAPAGSGLRLRNVMDSGGMLVPCNNLVPHPVTQFLVAENIQVSRFTLFDFDSDYEALLTIDANPLLLVQNDKASKIAVMPFSVHYSNIALQPEWIILLYNIFDYFLPTTVNGTAYEVNEEIVLNARGPRVTYSTEEGTESIEEFPATLRLTKPDTYALRQELYFADRDPVTVNIFVRIPREESNLWAVADSLEDPYKEDIVGSSYDDLLVYLAAALVVLLFAEWILHSREGR